jgi:mannose-1-phosphate guanylyltransferase/mannose-6-phosphate isomerase
MARYTPVLIAGGSGSRLWPLSRRQRPKQFQPILEDVSLLQAAAEVLGGEAFGPPLLVTGAEHVDLARDQLEVAGFPPLAILAEPAPRGTAPALAAAAAWLSAAHPDTVAVAMNADNRITDAPALLAAVEAAGPGVSAGRVVLLGATPTEPSDAYGYLRTGPQHDALRRILSFEEKPSRATAQTYLDSGDYLWNAGIYAFRPQALAALAAQHAPLVLAAVEAALAQAWVDGPVVRLGAAFAEAPNIAVDYAIFEKAQDLMAVAADVGWSDVGSWAAVWQSADRDAAGNAVRGPAHLSDAKGSLVFSDGPPVLVAGIEDLVVVAAGGRVLVARRDDPDGLRRALATLPDAAR